MIALCEHSGSGPVDLPEELLTACDLSRCLSVLLWLLHWPGREDNLLAALPHAKPDIDVTDVRNTLAVLGFPTKAQNLGPGGVDPRRLPAILLTPGRPAAVVYRDELGKVLKYDGSTGEVSACAPEKLRGTLLLVEETKPSASQQSWFKGVARRFRGDLPALVGASGLMALVGLAVPSFTMAVFDTVIAGHSLDTLPMLVAGALAAVLMEVVFRSMRQKALLGIAERLDRLVPSAVYTQLMSLPTALVERAGTAAQVSRLRDFSAIREFLTGSFAVAVLDIPFTLLVIILMVTFGGWVALVPVGTALGFVLIYFASRSPMRLAIERAARTNQAREALAVEALETVRTLKLGKAEECWTDRYAAAAASAAVASADVSTLSGAVLAASQALVTLSGLAAVVIGVLSVIGGMMSAGALIAGMMLIWRVLGPMQMFFMMLSRWEQTSASIRQVDGLMALETERPNPWEARMASPSRVRSSSIVSPCVTCHRRSLSWRVQASPSSPGRWSPSRAPKAPASPPCSS
jgi:ATP-binding cassette subfamily C protein/ATP-binding cassette subfamily C protein LapB